MKNSQYAKEKGVLKKFVDKKVRKRKKEMVMFYCNENKII